jgi:hypothetical protein
MEQNLSIVQEEKYLVVDRQKTYAVEGRSQMLSEK